MRILHTADWHLGRTLEGRDRLPEQVQFIDELCAIVDDEAIDLILIAGDVFDTVNPPALAEDLYYDALARLSDGGRRAVVVIAGNHDSPERLVAPAPLARRHGIHLLGLPYDTGMRGITVPVPGSDDPAIIAALPYPSEARLNQVLTEHVDEVALQQAYSDRVSHVFSQMALDFRPDAVNLAMSHIFVAGGRESDSERPIQIGTASTVHPQAMPAGAQYVALGHLHRPQEIRSSPVPTRYSGSPLAYSFSEVNQAKSVTIVDVLPGQAAAVEQRLLSAGKPLVRWEAKDGLAQVDAWCTEGRDANAWIDLEIHLAEPLTLDQINKLRLWHKGFVRIRPMFNTDTERTAASAGRSRLPVDELFTRYYEQQIGQTPPSVLTELFVRLVVDENEDQIIDAVLKGDAT